LTVIKGKVVNHNESFISEITFDEKINQIKKIPKFEDDIFIIPGFIDLHCHGGNGYDTMEGWRSIEKMASYHLSRGTTTLLATTWTSTPSHTYDALKEFNKNISDDSNLIGVHLEGPFINPNKLGAQPALTQKPSKGFIEEIKKIADIKVITLAPELDGMDEFIDYLNQSNIKVQFGHTLADYNCCKKYMDQFNIGFTHLYNAMSGNDHRNPGVLSAALQNSQYAEIICDLHHVSEQAIKIAKKCIPGLYTITDSIGAAGLKDGNYKFANIEIEKKKEKVTLKNSSTLAGSVASMHTNFLNLLNIQYTIEEAVSMTSYNASQYLKLDGVGLIKEGMKSNFVLLDKSHNIVDIYLNGKKIDR
tara:strand:- start:137 stop:1219 length:1083 start_codon:yes stop_codon:yes gene_type:complete